MPEDLLVGFAWQLREVGQALSSMPHSNARNNPACTNLARLSEQQLVTGGTCRCSGCPVDDTQARYVNQRIGSSTNQLARHSWLQCRLPQRRQTWIEPSLGGRCSCRTCRSCGTCWALQNVHAKGSTTLLKLASSVVWAQYVICKGCLGNSCKKWNSVTVHPWGMHACASKSWVFPL
jgi:hypothetical protein